MVDRLLKNNHIKNTLAILFVLLVLISSFVISYINYEINKNILYQNIDQKLKTIALSTKFILGESFFQEAVDADSISHEEDVKNILKLSQLVNSLEVEYIYTMIKKDDEMYFTSSSAKDMETKSGKMTKYFDKYHEATKVLLNILDKEQIVYEESTDKWGTFRTVFISAKTKNGNSYVIGADIKIDVIEAKLNKFIQDIIFIQIIISFFLSIFAFYFIKISKKELQDIRFINQQLDEEIEEKTIELAKINSSEDALKDVENPLITIIIDNNMLSIEDNAGGIDDSIMDKICNPYFSTKNKNGTGLGLYMSKIIIEEHCDGNFSILNTNNGAKFTITIPNKEII